MFEPLDCIARLAALAPKPRVNLTRFHGVFAPDSRHRAFTPSPGARGPCWPRSGCQGRDGVAAGTEPLEGSSESEQRSAHAAIGCTLKGMKARRLRRVFGIEIERCAGGGGTLRIIACIEDRAGTREDPRPSSAQSRPSMSPEAFMDRSALGHAISRR